MGSITDWISSALSEPSEDQKRTLRKRGVDENSRVRFYSWTTPNEPCPCPRFTSNFGNRGQKIEGSTIFKITSPRSKLLGIEARRVLPSGKKKVLQYRTSASAYNPYVIGAEDAFKALWGGCDIWVVEGVYDKVALDKVVPACDAVVSTLRAGMDKNTMEMLSTFAGKASTVYIAYDNDDTGREKAQWLRRRLVSLGMRCEVWTYRGKDPNEVWKIGGEKLLRRMFL